MSTEAAAQARAKIRRLPSRGKGGDGEYLDVKHRILWLRGEHPDAKLTTRDVSIDDETAIFRAEIALATGGVATGYGSETASDFKDYIEKAETKAIGRALNALGYGTAAAMADDDREAGGAVDQPVWPAGNSPARAQSGGNSAAPGSRPAVVEQWTAFWAEMKAQGIPDRAALEAKLGAPMGGRRPDDLRAALHRVSAAPSIAAPATAPISALDELRQAAARRETTEHHLEILARARFGRGTLAELQPDEIEALRAWVSRPDGEDWDWTSVLAFAIDLDSAPDTSALEVISGDIRHTGLQDTGNHLRAIYNRRKLTLRAG